MRILKKFRRRRKLLSVWLICLAVLLVPVLTSLSNSGALQVFLDNWLRPLGLLIVVLVLAYVALRYLTREVAFESFRHYPENYHRKVIEFHGRVAYVFPDTFLEMIKRKGKDYYRTFTSNEDKRGRYIHQRFLVTSPQLISGERIVVHHNVKFGRVSLKKGAWVYICGEYIHQTKTKKTFLGKKKFKYGLIHFTHPPKGKLERVKRPPSFQKHSSPNLLPPVSAQPST